ncbi:hypothetical protein [Mucilaginibacter gracilis]|nr:hypothetical protein [Mucilaginibacter gracilis]
MKEIFKHIHSVTIAGLTWHGNGPQKLIDKAYPQWAKQNGLTE